MNSHARLLKLGLDTNPITATKLLNAYVSSNTHFPNSLTYAYQLFEQVPHKDTTLWTSIISAFNRAGNSYKALHLFSQMFHQMQPNHFVYATVARACGSSVTHLQLGKTVHSLVIKTGFLSNVVLETSLLDMYGKCGLVEFSRKLFDEMPGRNIVSWNAMIAAYVSNGWEVDGIELFYQMKCKEFESPDEFAFDTVLSGCAGVQDLKLGMQLHAGVLIAGFEKECASAICNMYLRCAEVSAAERILWERGENALLEIIMIKGYVYNGRHLDAIRFIASTKDSIRMVTNDLSVVVSVLTACADLSLLRIGRQVHGVIITLLGLHSHFQSVDSVTVILSALIDMYCKCSSIGEAQRVFDNQNPPQDISHWNAMITGYINNGLLNDAIQCFIQMPERNVVSWTAMISGYVDNSLPHEGLQLLAEMYCNKVGIVVQGNCVTFAVALEAAGLLTALEPGKQIHAKLIQTTVKADTHNVIVGTALVDMYSKSGNLIYAKTVFSRMMEKNVVSWTSMITGYATHGLGFQALDLFQQMTAIGVVPNEVTFISVLTSCSHCGLVEEGMKYFKLMTDEYGIVPRSDHYACLVDLLGRAGKLTESFKLLQKIEEEETSSELYGGAIWGALLGACTLHGHVELGHMVAVKMLEKKQQVAETYIALSNIYAAAGMWDEAFKVREMWGKRSGDLGKPGQSRIFIHHSAPQS
ncbi:Pentatricopeptide repeat [Thalictrum thalictroides]|uniref:Pentatricopeptide repeat n=1 Tax=Thalictrum thalictroides TaxID=46969 RepID=A0A7J6XD15_THATH|nr:Pentatricopeptide repeat [Thalictrum thalictroides]